MDMRTEKKIAVVMPVHNTPHMYLAEALTSLKNQSFQDFRLICVDDGSTDAQTLRTLQKWSETYENMQVVYLPEAAGAAEARNTGLNMVKEEYVIFLDSDDIFEAGFLEKMYACITVSNADVCVCGWTTFSEKEEDMGCWKPAPDAEREDEFFLRYQCFNPWSKLCRREFLIKNNICFQNLPSCNDVYYSISVLLEADDICYIEESLIRYRAMTTHQISSRRDPIYLAHACKKLIERYKKQADSKKRIQILLILLLLMKGECKTDESYRQLSAYILENILENIECECIQNKTMKKIVSLIQIQDYNLYTANEAFSYESQLCDNGEELLCRLKECGEIYLWGLGKRGEAFQKFCKENDIVISAVADSENIGIGEKNVFGNGIISTTELLRHKGAIIACNNAVYEMLGESYTNGKVLNLQQYCPL